MPRAPIGVPGSEPELALQVNVSNPNRKLRFDLPGAVYQVGPRSYLLALIPMARIVLAGTAPQEFALAHFGERRRQQTEDALAPLVGKRGRVSKFSIRVESDETFGDVVAAAPTRRPLAVEMRVLLGVAGRTTPLRSDVFPARMALTKDRGPSGNSDDTDEGSHIWDCHSHWYSMAWGFGHYTLCHTKTACPAGTACRCNGGGNCKGWCMCVCK